MNRSAVIAAASRRTPVRVTRDDGTITLGRLVHCPPLGARCKILTSSGAYLTVPMSTVTLCDPSNGLAPSPIGDAMLGSARPDRPDIWRVPLVDLTQPRDGEAIIDAWWVADDGGAYFWTGAGGMAPQCNRNRDVAERIRSGLYPDADLHLVPVAYVGQVR